MEITYDLIVKYLVYHNNSFSNKKNVSTFANMFPLEFKNLLSDKFYKCGVTINDTNSNLNISFWSSLLTLINDKYNMLLNIEEISEIGKFKNELLEIKKKCDPFIIRDKLSKEPDDTILQYVVDSLNINIIILNFKNNNISVLYHKKEMNPYKSILLLSNYDNMWEPIMKVKTNGDVQRIFNYDDEEIKKILSYDKLEYYNNLKPLLIIKDINKILKVEKDKLHKNKINNDIFIKDEEELKVPTDSNNKYSHLNKTKLTKMKNDELILIIKDLNLELPQKILKATLIDMILEKI